MVKAAQSNTIEAVVFYDWSRWARDQWDHLRYATLLRGRGVLVVSATQNDSFGRAMEGFLAITNRLLNDLTSEKSKKGMKATLAQGRWTWKAPLGYRQEDGKMVIDATSGPLVREMFEAIACGKLQKEKALEYVTACGLRTKAGRPLRWDKLNKSLRNPIYFGLIENKKWGISV